MENISIDYLNTVKEHNSQLQQSIEVDNANGRKIDFNLAPKGAMVLMINSADFHLKFYDEEDEEEYIANKQQATFLIFEDDCIDKNKTMDLTDEQENVSVIAFYSQETEYKSYTVEIIPNAAGTEGETTTIGFMAITDSLSQIDTDDFENGVKKTRIEIYDYYGGINSININAGETYKFGFIDGEDIIVELLDENFNIIEEIDDDRITITYKSDKSTTESDYESEDDETDENYVEILKIVSNGYSGAIFFRVLKYDSEIDNLEINPQEYNSTLVITKLLNINTIETSIDPINFMIVDRKDLSTKDVKHYLEKKMENKRIFAVVNEKINYFDGKNLKEIGGKVKEEEIADIIKKVIEDNYDLEDIKNEVSQMSERLSSLRVNVMLDESTVLFKPSLEYNDDGSFSFEIPAEIASTSYTIKLIGSD